MATLPFWVDDILYRNHIQITRYGRTRKGRPTSLERRWFFCGWYYYKELQKKVVDGPYGPFPCKSAAMISALDRYRLADNSKHFRWTKEITMSGALGEIESSLAAINETDDAGEGYLNNLIGASQQHDARVTELLLANNREVERRRRFGALLLKCARQFRDYQIGHLAKGTPESLAKAETNRAFANEIEVLLHEKINAPEIEILKVRTVTGEAGDSLWWPR